LSDPRPASRLDRLRLVLGFAILPAAAAILAFWVHRVVWSSGPYDGARWSDPVDAAIAFAAGVAVIAVIVTVAGAVPTISWLLTQDHVSLKQILIARVALGNAPFAIVVAGVLLLNLAGPTTSADVAHVLSGPPMGAVRAIVIGSAIGVVSGIVFWAVAIRGTRYGQRDRSDLRPT
jgi:hypothetical protein